MSNHDDHSPQTPPFDPAAVDPRRAFEMGAEMPPGADPPGWRPPSEDEIDKLFPEYRVTGVIGRGGMGVVYRGTQTSLDREVAIKILPPEIAGADPSFAERFEHEAKAMAQFDHPNIVHVYDFGLTETGSQGDGFYFIVMEFVDGTDFHQLIHSGELKPSDALSAVSQVCRALEYAHTKGYVHRDIKPANILISRAGVVKVGDFGLAKIVGAADEPMFTRTGAALGTPAYSAPEQLDGRDTDHRADIYSLGVMLYEMLTNELPRGNFPPPSQKVQVDVRIDEVVLRAMQSEPAKRYPAATQMLADIDGVRGGAVTSKKKAEAKLGSGSRSPFGWVAIGLTVLLSLCVGLFASLLVPKLLSNAGNGSVLLNIPPQVIGSGEGRQLGYASLDTAPVFDEARPSLRVPEKFRDLGALHVSRMEFFPIDYEPVPDDRGNVWPVARELNLWIAADPDRTYCRAIDEEGDGKFRVGKDLKDGAYCVHTGTINDAGELPHFASPFVVRGLAKPMIDGITIQGSGLKAQCQFTVHNAGEGWFNGGECLVNRMGETDTGKFIYGRKKVVIPPIRPGGEFRSSVEWEFVPEAEIEEGNGGSDGKVQASASLTYEYQIDLFHINPRPNTGPIATARSVPFALPAAR